MFRFLMWRLWALLALLAGSFQSMAAGYGEDYSGAGHWYLSAGYEAGHIDQELTGLGNVNVSGPLIGIGGVGPEGVRFSVGLVRLSDRDEEWVTSGTEADLWVPGSLSHRVRPYLILGAGFQRFYGDRNRDSDDSFFAGGGIDSAGVSYKFGIAFVANITDVLEMDAGFIHRRIRWDADILGEENEDSDDAHATANSFRLTLRQLF